MNDLIAYYQALLAYQYATQPNAQSTIAALVRCAIIDLVPVSVREGFNLDTATGTQLDVIGLYVGLPRAVNVELTDRNYWRLRDYSVVEDVTGLTDYTDSATNTSSVFYRYYLQNLPAYQMTDDEYRFMLRFKIALNNSDNTLYSIQTALQEFFGDQIEVWDTTDMVIGYYIKPELEVYAKIALASNLLPKPMAVGLSGVFVVDDPNAMFSLVDYATGSSLGLGMNDYEDETTAVWLDYSDALTLT